MKKKYFFLTIVLFTTAVTHAQFTRYIIQLKDKANTPYSLNNPIQFLSQRAIDRRTRYGIPVDSTDLPVVAAYIDSIENAGSVTILSTSRWFNQVCIKTSDVAALAKIEAFPFVVSVPPIAARPARSRKNENRL